jgi:hypothetical protein
VTHFSGPRPEPTDTAIAVTAVPPCEPEAPVSHRQPDAESFPDIAAADIASMSFVIEERSDISRSTKPTAGGPFRDQERLEDFQRNPGSTEIRSFDLTDIILIPACVALLHANRMVSETRYLFNDDDYRRHWSELSDLQFAGAGKTAVIGFNGAYGNYYHWMMQCLPAIDWSIRNAGAENSILVVPPLSAWQEETLALLGLAGTSRMQVELDRQYHFPRVHYCGYLNGSAAFFLSPRCLRVLDRLAARVDQPGDCPRRLYISRSDSGKRALTNEDEVRGLLERYGFVSIVPGHYSIRDQVRLFRGARFIIGAHGAGLTNIAFCDPETWILELVHSSYLNSCINRIAQGRNLRYHAECFDGGVGTNWAVDPGQLKAKLEALIMISGLDA